MVRWGGDWGTLVRAIKEGFLEEINLRPESEKELTMRTFQVKETASSESLKLKKRWVDFNSIYS